MKMNSFVRGSIFRNEMSEAKASAPDRLGDGAKALLELAACPRTADHNRAFRNGPVEQAGYARWLFAMQSDGYDLNDVTTMMRQYGVPNEVFNRMGPSLTQLRAEKAAP